MAMTAWSERLHQLDLSGGERAHLVPGHADERAVAPLHRHPKQRAEAAGALLGLQLVFRIFEHVRNLHNPFLELRRKRNWTRACPPSSSSDCPTGYASW
jgi:hypothetical protein